MACPPKPPLRQLSDETLDFFFHHLFLPPKLPGEDDASPIVEQHLIRFVLDCLRLFSANSEPQRRPAVHAAIELMENMERTMNDQGHIHSGGMRQVLERLGSTGMTQSPYFLKQLLIITSTLQMDMLPFMLLPRMLGCSSRERHLPS
jgi:hypothetical protein